MYPRIKKVFIQATQDQVEIRRWYEESQENGAEIAYELRREADLSSKMATRGIETSYNGKFSSDGGILGVDYNWAKSCTRGIVEKMIPSYVGPKKNGVRPVLTAHTLFFFFFRQICRMYLLYLRAIIWVNWRWRNKFRNM
jgi:hypothetical protein